MKRIKYIIYINLFKLSIRNIHNKYFNGNRLLAKFVFIE